VSRPGWDEYFIDLLPKIGSRATCNRGKSGCIITTPEHTIITTGYVGAPAGLPHCDEVGHLFETVIDGEDVKSVHCVRTLHSEKNALLQAAEEGKSVRGGILYCTMFPCYRCAMDIIRVKISRVCTAHDYHKSKQSKDMFDRVEIKWSCLGPLLKY
jgi:dCMP deaminase